MTLHKEERVEKAEQQLEDFREQIQRQQRICMKIAANTAEGKGFWDGKDVDDRFPEAIALIHSELSEALEAHRNDNHRGEDSVLEELVDAMLRIYDLAYHYEMSDVQNQGPLSGEYFDTQLTQKMKRNLERPEKHGKNY